MTTFFIPSKRDMDAARDIAAKIAAGEMTYCIRRPGAGSIRPADVWRAQFARFNEFERMVRTQTLGYDVTRLLPAPSSVRALLPARCQTKTRVIKLPPPVGAVGSAGRVFCLPAPAAAEDDILPLPTRVVYCNPDVPGGREVELPFVKWTDEYLIVRRPAGWDRPGDELRKHRETVQRELTLEILRIEGPRPEWATSSRAIVTKLYHAALDGTGRFNAGYERGRFALHDGYYLDQIGDTISLRHDDVPRTAHIVVTIGGNWVGRRRDMIELIKATPKQAQTDQPAQVDELTAKAARKLGSTQGRPVYEAHLVERAVMTNLRTLFEFQGLGLRDTPVAVGFGFHVVRGKLPAQGMDTVLLYHSSEPRRQRVIARARNAGQSWRVGRVWQEAARSLIQQIGVQAVDEDELLIKRGLVPATAEGEF